MDFERVALLLGIIHNASTAGPAYQKIVSAVDKELRDIMSEGAPETPVVASPRIFPKNSGVIEETNTPPVNRRA